MRRHVILAFLVAFGAIGAPSRARAQTCVVNVPHTDGQWVTLPYLMPVNPISTTLLHDGRILIVSDRRTTRATTRPARKATAGASGTRPS